MSEIIIAAAFLSISGFHIRLEHVIYYIICAVFLCGIFIILLLTEKRLGNIGGEKVKSIIPAAVVVILFAVLELLMLTYFGNYSVELYNQKTFFLGTTSVAYIVFLLGIFAAGYIAFRRKKGINWGLLTLLVCSFIFEYNRLMSSRNYVTSYSVCISLAVLIALLLNFKVKRDSLKKACVITGCLVICMACMSQKIACAFSWWGSNNSALYEETYPVDVKGLEGFKVSEEHSNMLQQVYRTVESNTDENSTVLGYPFVTMFNVLNNKDFPGFVLVHFYDVCSDKYALRDAELFKEDPPDIIIYVDIPGCLEHHEKVFRNGERAGQRDIMEWLAISNQYTPICHASNVFVYKLIDNGIDIGYTYFEDDDNDNISLNEVLTDLVDEQQPINSQ